MADSSRQCGVCHVAESKYKCPVCSLRYCSLTCYKTHRPVHNDSNATPSQSSDGTAKLRDRPGTKQRVPKVDLTGFESDPDLLRLLQRYPLLRYQLQTLYGLTLDPGPDEERSWHRQPLYGDAPADSSRGRGRGRGRAFRRPNARGDHTRSSEERPRGPWTREKGHLEAMISIKRMRDGNEDDAKAEGMREFIELCQLKFGSGGSGVLAQHHAVAPT